MATRRGCYQRLVEKEQAAVDVGTQLDAGLRPGPRVDLRGRAAGRRRDAAPRQLIDEEIARLAQEGPTPTELTKARNQALVGFWRGLETISGKAQALGEYEVFHGDYRKLFGAPAEYESITADDVKSAAAHGTAARKPHGRRARAEGRARRRAAAPAREVRMTCRSALRAVAALPARCCRSLPHCGAGEREAAGLPAARRSPTARRRRPGRKARHAAGVDERHRPRRRARRPGRQGRHGIAVRRPDPEGRGQRAMPRSSPRPSRTWAASLSAGAGTESLGVSASFLSRDVDLMLELVADVLQRPRLDAAEFDKARTLAVQSIVAAKDSDPRALIEQLRRRVAVPRAPVRACPSAAASPRSQRSRSTTSSVTTPSRSAATG